jgi:hypothetical protein
VYNCSVRDTPRSIVLNSQVFRIAWIPKIEYRISKITFLVPIARQLSRLVF